MSLDDVSQWLAARYGYSQLVDCRLLRSYTNDVYHVSLPDRQAIFKIYGQGWRTESEIRHEAALIQHLRSRGLEVAAPILTMESDVLVKRREPGGDRFAVLFEHAPGHKPEPPFTSELYVAFGRAVARMHELSIDFVTEHLRRPLDLTLLIEEPLAQILPLLETPRDREYLTALAGQVKGAITGFAAEALECGPIHGDATLDNLHVTPDGGIVLFDFDMGGPGYRSADLQGWAAGSAEHKENWEAFHRGYASVRALDKVNLLAAPFLTVAWDIWGMKIDLDRRMLGRGPEQVKQYLENRMTQLRERTSNGFIALPFPGV